ncbi:MAG: PilZ domain-containing protein [Candidatus Methylomirabilales bacterium]
MEGEKDRRRNIRWALEERTAGRITAIYEAFLIDISTSGALIEHSDVVRPGTLSVLTFFVQGQKVSLRCRVIRSAVHRTEPRTEKERELIFRTGVEFLDVSEDSLRLIGGYLDSVRGEG